MAAGVSLLSEQSYCSREISVDMETANTRVPTAKYTKMGETLRHVIPGHMQCSMACGGRACKYENPSRWSDEEQAIKGLYSSWITENLLAMARPSTEIIEKYNIIEQFQRCDLRTVINLQRPGEHASCGNSLEPESGFTYRPEVFMEAGIYFYNFEWKDYGVASLTTILDMVKVMSFAIQEGKMAVHCHAGLGRTGVLLACYLVFTSRMSADQAILFVRAKRPNSIQTRGQLLCVREFAQFLVPLRSVFACAEPKAHAVTLTQYLTRQRHLLHGYEARQMKNVPKIVQLACRLLLDIADDRQVEAEPANVADLAAEVEKTVSQQALQLLGREMRGKGIPVPPPPSPCADRPVPTVQAPSLHDQPLMSDNDLDPLWWRQHEESPLKSLLHCKRSLSYSDSALCILGLGRERQGSKLQVNHLIKRFLSHSSLTSCRTHRVPPQDILSNARDLGQKTEVRQDARSPLMPTQQHKGLHNPSLCLSAQGRKAYSSVACSVPAAGRSPGAATGASVGNDTDWPSQIPLITLQSERSLEARRLLVAKALAMDPPDEDLVTKLATWQTELNSREGVWERLCSERDPLILSALMWSWLEQLKDPVISGEDVRELGERHYEAHNALDSLEKGHRLTLLCILDCAAHLLVLPEEVETAFLNQTIKAFTKIPADSESNRALYKTLKAILRPILHEMRQKAADERGSS